MDTLSSKEALQSNIAPICNTSAIPELNRYIDSRGIPQDEYEHHQWLSKVVLNRPSELLDALVDEHLQIIKGRRTGKYLDDLRWHLEQVLLNLGRSLACNQWLLSPNSNQAYTTNTTILGRQGFSARNMKLINKYLKDSGLAYLAEGKVYANNPKTTRLFPTKRLSPELAELALNTQQPFDGNYLQFTDKQSAYRLLELPKDHPDLATMSRINEYLEGHSWAIKAPIVLKYKSDPFTGGRLYTPFQGLPSRKFSVRQNTLLDGERIVELDYSASHLRLCMAVMAGQDAGEKPYEAIIEAAGEAFDRDAIKLFITVAMGSDDRKKAYRALNSNGYTNQTIQEIETATLAAFPGLVLYNSFGVQAQSLEGQILIQAMLTGIEQDIPMLPLHDAVIVKEQDAVSAAEIMKSAWSDVVGKDGVRARVAAK